MTAEATTTEKGLLFDATRCVGCGACYYACKGAHAQPAGHPLDDVLSATTFTVLREVNGGKGAFLRKLCWHCESPACASVCPVKAIEKTPEGPVAYDESLCMGCRYCMQACPFSVPRYEWDRKAPRIRKCDMCRDRVREGSPTECSRACPTGATKFGNRNELLAEARERIRAEPGRYHDRIYGEDGMGGSAVLVLSPVPLESLGAYPAGAGTEPLPQLTLDVLHKLPYAVSAAGVILGGIWWITRRRMVIEDEAVRVRETATGGREEDLA